MTGQYQTSLTPSGEYFLNMNATLIANEALNPDDSHYAIVGLGSK